MALRCLNLFRKSHIISRRFVHTPIVGNEKCSEPYSRGLVLGVYADEGDKLDAGILTPMAWRYNKVYLSIMTSMNII